LLLLLRHGADLRLHFLGILVAVFSAVGYLRRNSALRCVGFDITDHLDFGLAETSDHLQASSGTHACRWPLDQFATLLGLFPQGYELPHAVIRGRSSLRGSRSTLERGAVTGAAPVTEWKHGSATDGRSRRPPVHRREMANR